MGGGISTQGDLSQMIACTMMIGEAMFQGLDPRYVRFPDMYRLYDFHVGKTKFRSHKPGGSVTYVVFNADGSTGVLDRSKLQEEASSAPKGDSNATDIDEEDTSKYLIVHVGEDRIVLALEALNTPNDDGWTPLHASCHTLNAAEAGKTIIKAILAQDPSANLNQKTIRGPGSFTSGYTPLHIACAYGMETLVTQLIKAKADVHVTNDVQWTPLHEACHRGFTPIVKELLRAGAKAETICPEFALCPFPGQTPLGEAARQGHLDTVKLLLEHGVDKNAVNALNWTALHEAAYHNRTDVVRTLVVYGADVLIETNRGAKASDLTISCEIKTMLEDMSQAERKEASKKSPPKPAVAIEASDSGGGGSSSPKERSGPLSRKEDFALLGDLPALQRLHVPDESDQVVKPDKKVKKKKKHRERDQSEELPKELQCAITQKLLREPMQSPYGHVFEKSVIEKWIENYGHRCPITGEPLALSQLVPAVQLQDEIHAWQGGGSPKKEDAKTTVEEEKKVDKEEAKCEEEVKQDDDLYDF
ncbi:hypothetical protein AeMF1_003529 [Aphanomyces euteiches]|nr:hypothetical protein AeMF1_003529 [Aphanomyces euteiches]KAH9186054.1 hypothetical protein AeNC1_011973 [Aphanomyces euteiches]